VKVTCCWSLSCSLKLAQLHVCHCSHCEAHIVVRRAEFSLAAARSQQVLSPYLSLAVVARCLCRLLALFVLLSVSELSVSVPSQQQRSRYVVSCRRLLPSVVALFVLLSVFELSVFELSVSLAASVAFLLSSFCCRSLSCLSCLSLFPRSSGAGMSLAVVARCVCRCSVRFVVGL